MICTYCKRVFKGKTFDVSRFFNTRKGTDDTCSETCYNIVKREHKGWLTWYVNYYDSRIVIQSKAEQVK